MATAPEKLSDRQVEEEQLRDQIAVRLERVRARTKLLVEPLSEDALNRVHDPLLSPMVWDLGHMATFEDLWLVQQALGRPALRGDLGLVYDPSTAPREERGELPYLRSEDAFKYLDAVRERTLECLAEADLSPDSPEPLLRNGYVYELILYHERQHAETILQTLQIMTSEEYRPERASEFPGPDNSDFSIGKIGNSDEMVFVAAGDVEIGTSELVFSYDNERPAHRVHVEPFLIDQTPVTNGALIEFIEAGGYAREELWSEGGRRWLSETAATLPRYWRRDGDGFLIRSFADWLPADPELPVCHVTWFEADAYARFAGKRLPTEHEWETAASWDSADSTKRAFPWGEQIPADRERANLGQLAFTTAPAGSFPDGVSPCGALQMAGDVWEWTASGFDAYPGFAAYPYPEYSEDFFGGPFRVLRGGSWATANNAINNTFRNWDHPERSQIFSGFRCACNADSQPETAN